jgi:hypothetical protein
MLRKYPVKEIFSMPIAAKPATLPIETNTYRAIGKNTKATGARIYHSSARSL